MKINLLYILFFYTCTLFSQQVLTGVIYDEEQHPMPYVNVIIKGTKIGTITDIDGNFKIHSQKNRGKIEITYVGYATQILRFTTKKTHFKVILIEEDNQLEEVTIVAKPKKRLKKKENPAYRILKEVWKRKKKNGLQQVAAYQYQKLLTTEISLNNLDSTFLKKVFKNETNDVIDRLPINEDGIRYSIPLYINEKVYKIYGNNNIKKERIDIEAERNNGFNSKGFVFDRISNAFTNIDIYKNNIQILQKSFVSPISSAGFETYDYVLHDSIIKNNKKFYGIYFFPRRNGDLAFEGNVWIADKNFVVSKIKMRIHKDINLNFVRRLSFEKEYIINNDSIYLPKTNNYEGDFTIIDKDDETKGMTVKKTSEFIDYKFDSILPNSFYYEQIEKYKPNQFKKNHDYWQAISNDPIKAETYQLIDNVKNKKEIKKISGVLTTLSSGYITLSPTLQLGEYWNTFIRNSVEGFKMRIGFRTFKTIDDRFRMSGFVGHGFKDKRFKYGLESKYLLSYKPRIIIGASYLYDIEQLGAKLLNTNGLNANVFDPNALFSRGKNYFLSFVNKSVLKFDIQLKQNLHFGISATYNQIKSASPKDFSIDYLSNDKIKTTVNDINTDIYIAYTPGRNVFGLGVEQKFGKNIFPSIVINYRKGYKNIFNSDFNYDKIQLRYTQPIFIGKLGILRTSIDAGKTFGTVPISLLSAIPANQTYWLTKNTFSLMNYYDFVTDTYVSGHFEHHFEGYLMNKIPLLKEIKLRSLLTFKTTWGTISDENISINKSSINYAAPSDKLYYEYGFGFENIGYKNIRPLRVDFLWRGDHKSVNNLPSPKFAVRIGIRPGF